MAARAVPFADGTAAAARLLEREPPSLEELLTARDLFGLVDATPLQRAVCRIADGTPLGELAAHPHVLAAVGASIPPGRPAELCLVSGIRTAKSMLAAADGVRMSQTCDVSRLSAGEVPRVSIVSLSTDLARVVLGHLVGNLSARPRLKALLLDEPKADSVLLRHPSGRAVEVRVVAGSRAGASLTARWSAGVIFDEAPKMIGTGDGVVNLTDMRANVIGRLLPGAQIVDIGSPWAPFGPVYEMVANHWKRPTSRLVVIKAPAWWMNPAHWTEAYRAYMEEHDPRAFRTDGEAEFADADEALIPTATLDRCTRATPLDLPPEPGLQYVAAMDPATRGNAWTLVVATRKAGRRIVALARQWRGSTVTPLDPAEVLAQIAAALRPYGLEAVETDQWSTDALRVIARQAGLRLDEWPATSASNAEMYLEMRRRLDALEVELPPDGLMKADLQRLRRVTTQAGVRVELPQTTDGRHCDYAPPLARVLRRFLEEPAKPAPKAGSVDHLAKLQADMLAQAQKRHGTKRAPWWRR